MKTEKWIAAFNKKGTNQHILPDESWVNYMKGVYDSRDIMSDVARPVWENSGEYIIEIIPADKNHNSDKVFTVYANKEWGNRIAASIQSDVFATMSELITALRELGQEYGVYKCPCSKEYIEIGLEERRNKS